ncbi:uncharacterized protein LOC131240618 isoform X4 [Magnolia sinica]|uniref:uncharacterized protein LOC131240618 isoform X4 n=1 Tax=Magnolia sinica TaxID=86752 RepID=UPI00265A89C8|nr:uncharacterized protein LOC131240618 isoform X4 [Magnolia sinica]
MLSISSCPSAITTTSATRLLLLKPPVLAFPFRPKFPINDNSTFLLRAEMSSSSSLSSSMVYADVPSPLPALPEKRIVVGCGAVGLDFLATVATYPKPDDKIRSTSLKVQGGGNTGNALTSAARLGLTPRVISKVAEEGNSPFTYVIVDNETKTRTCIHTPGHPPMTPGDLLQSSLFSALDGARLVYFDGRLHETALVIAKEATRMQIPILIDAERKREGLDDLLNHADYVVCSAKFPQAWTTAPSVPSALVSMMLRLPHLKFVIVTLGGDGCIMLERSSNEEPESKEIDVDSLLESLKLKIDSTKAIPTCLSSKSKMRLSAGGIGTVSGKLLVGTAEKIPPSELIDTTGAGDAFIGVILYAICAGMPPETMLPFAAQVAAAGCRSLGARTGLPRRTDPRLAPFLH